MPRAALFHMGIGARCECLLKLRRSSLIVLADEVGGWDIAPGGASELGSLHRIRLWDQPRGPQRCLRWWEVAAERLVAVQDVEAAVGLDVYENSGISEKDDERTYMDVTVGRFVEGAEYGLALTEKGSRIEEEMDDASW